MVMALVIVLAWLLSSLRHCRVLMMRSEREREGERERERGGGEGERKRET